MKLKKKVEALLFSSGRKMDITELMKLCRSSYEELEQVLNDLSKDYDEKQSSLMVVKEGDSWKISVREEHLDLVKKIVTQTELSKSLMETLAVIAFKYPIKQADLIKIRTNKAYDHLNELEESGYITRQKFGRTKLIKLTKKFFDYFSLPEEKLKEQFKDFNQLAESISEKEKEIKRINEDYAKMAEVAKKEKESREKIGGIEIEDDDIKNLESYNRPKESPKIEVIKEKLGDFEVVEPDLEGKDGEESPMQEPLEQNSDKGQDNNLEANSDDNSAITGAMEDPGRKNIIEDANNDEDAKLESDDNIAEDKAEEESEEQKGEESEVNKKIDNIWHPKKEKTDEDIFNEKAIDEIYDPGDKELEKRKNDEDNKS